MKPLRVHQRLLVFLTAALAITCVISPWMALGADWFAATWPHILPERVPFSKVFNRAFMIAGIVSFIVYRRWLLPPDLHPLLAPGSRVAVRNFLAGWVLAVLSMVLLATAMVAADVFDAYFRLSLATSLSRIGSALAAGITVGFFEELFFRGILFLGLAERGRRIRAYILANLFYAALHFVKPGEHYFMDRLDLLAGFRHLLTTFEPFLEPLSIVPGLTGLFLTGVVLSYALDRTRNLYLSIGLHAGWIFCLKTFRVFGNFSRGDLGWAFGSTDPKIVSGVITWLGILLVALAIAYLTRQTALLSGGVRPQRSL